MILPFVTAYHILYNTGPLLPGDRVLIHAASSHLGLACVQLAISAQCEVLGTCGSSEKLALLAQRGVKHPINYNAVDFEDAVKKLTNSEVS